MPTYDYQCTACGHTFEIMQSMKDAPLVDCPHCQSKSLKRLLGTGAGIIFKGSGFYETDYKKKAPEKSAGESSAAEKKETTGTTPSPGASTSTGSSTGSPSSTKAP